MVTLNKQGGSMGMPEEMRESIQKKQEQKSAPIPPQNQEVPEEEISLSSKEASTEEDALTVGAQDILKRLGITIEEKDFQQLIIKGHIAKNVEIIPKYLTATLKTMTTEEFDTVDAIVGKEVRDLTMTSQGAEARRAVLNLCFAVTHINGKPLLAAPPRTESGALDYHEVIKQLRPVFRGMSATVVDRIIEKRNAYEVALNLATKDPTLLLKNS